MWRARAALTLLSFPGFLGAIDLKPGQALHSGFRAGMPAPEFTTQVYPGESICLTIDQGNNDLAAMVTMPDGRVVRFDQFEFGPEKIKITSPAAGAVRLTVAAVKASVATAEFSISRAAAAPFATRDEDEAAAEILATKAKAQAGEQSPETVSSLNEALDAWIRLHEDTAVARTHLARGDWYFSRSEWEEARRDYRAAIQECGNYLRCSAEAVNNAGIASLNLGDIGDAGRQFSIAGEAWRRLALPQLESRTLSNLGLLHYQASDLTLALADFSRAQRLLEPWRPLFLATVLNNTGLVYLALERYRDAVFYFSKALSVAGRYPGEARVQGRIRVNIGRAHMLDGELTAAMHDEDLAARLTNGVHDVSGKADALDNTGQIHYRLHNLAAAEAAFRQALDLYLQIGSARGLSSARFFLGLLAAERGDYNEARSQLESSLDIRLSRKLQNEAAETYYQLARVEKMRGNRSESLAFGEQAADTAERLRVQAPGSASRRTLFAARRKYFEYLIEETLADSTTRTGAAASAFRVAERARAQSLADSLNALPPEGKPASPRSAERRALLRQIAYKSAQLAAIAVNETSEAEGRELRNQIEQLVLADEQLAVSTIAVPGSARSPLPPGDIAELRSGFLGDSDALFEYWLGERKSFLWVIHGNRVDVRELPPRKCIEAAVQSLLSLLTDINGRKADPRREDAFQLARRQLSHDLEFVLDGAVPSRIVVIADGVLNRLPLALLPLRIRSAAGAVRSAGSLGLVAPLVQSPSAAVFMALSRRGGRIARPQSVIAFGDPIYSSDDDRVPRAPSAAGSRPLDAAGLALSRLAFSRLEMKTVAEAVPKANRTIFSDFEATRQNFLSGAQKSDGILLVSTHILADDTQPDLSSIVFSMVDRRRRPVDGLVHLYDFNNGELALNSALVALSACDGAGGRTLDAEGLQSLALGFILVGARGVVASVAEVDSEGAAYFMSAFLNSLLKGRASGADRALLNARRAMAFSKRWKDPYYWSTFALISGSESRPTL